MYYNNGNCRVLDYISGILFETKLFDGKDTYIIRHGEHIVGGQQCDGVIIWRGMSAMISKNANYLPIIAQSLVCDANLTFLPNIDNVTRIRQELANSKQFVLRSNLPNTNYIVDIDVDSSENKITKIVANNAGSVVTHLEMSYPSSGRCVSKLIFIKDKKPYFVVNGELSISQYEKNNDDLFSMTFQLPAIIRDYREDSARGKNSIYEDGHGITVLSINADPVKELDALLHHSVSLKSVIIITSLIFAGFVVMITLWRLLNHARGVVNRSV